MIYYLFTHIYKYIFILRDVSGCLCDPIFLTQSQDGQELPSARAHSADSCRSQGGLLVIGLVVTATQIIIQEFKKMHDH